VTQSEASVLVLAPVGRDAATCAKLVAQCGLASRICEGIDDLIAGLDAGGDVVVLTEEALYGKAIDPLERWVGSQPRWSDQPFVILTNRNEGLKFASFRAALVAKLRNVAFLERPLHAISVQTAVLTAKRGRERQYQARLYLESQQDAAEELERQVRLRTADLESAHSRLQQESDRRERAQAELLQAQKVESLGQLVGGVAHDFNNLLMAVIGNLDLLSKYVGDDPRRRRLLDGALEGARRGATLTQRLLAFARKQELQTRATDVASLVEDMRGLITRSVGPMVEVEIKAIEGLPPVSVDPNQLEMALLNLAVNARDAMPAGGTLTVSLDQIGLQADDTLAAGRYVRVSVEDTGEGMDAATLAKAVEPFFSTKGIGKGTGLGLSMVHGLAEQSGGLFRLESDVGRGTRAQLWLPVADGDVQGEGEVAPAQTLTSPSTILLVDDDPLIAASTAALLEDLGHHVVEANSGQGALELIDGGLRPDLVITDHAMPGMTGADLAAQLRLKAPELPILLATGFAEVDSQQTRDLPRLAKPYTQAQLSTEIARLLPEGRGGPAHDRDASPLQVSKVIGTP
jgi:signal transduction histidine kinase/CheY-like chemotaxis protein